MKPRQPSEIRKGANSSPKQSLGKDEKVFVMSKQPSFIVNMKGGFSYA